MQALLRLIGVSLETCTVHQLIRVSPFRGESPSSSRCPYAKPPSQAQVLCTTDRNNSVERREEGLLDLCHSVLARLKVVEEKAAGFTEVAFKLS